MRTRHRQRRVFLNLLGLEERLVMAAPVLEAIDTADLPVGKTLMIPLTANDADGDALTYTVTADNGQIVSVLKTGQPFLKMTIADYGDMVFQLFDDIAPLTVQKITGLVNDGFYDGLTIHRIEKDFVIQGGDPSGDGTGGPGFKFDDEFSLEAIFSGSAQLAMANSGKDTNGSQFFVTQGPARFLDFNHTIYGQMVRGFDVLQTLNTKTAPVTITSMSLVTNVTDAVLQLKAPALGSTEFTVTVTDTNGEFDTQVFTANSFTDTRNSPPILGPVGDQTTFVGKPVDIALTSFDFENDPMIYEASVLGTPAAASVAVVGNVVTVTPNAGYAGTFSLRVSVRQQGATDRGSTADPRDYQTISFTVERPFDTFPAPVLADETVAFTDVFLTSFTPNSPVAESAYTAAVDWGDGNTSEGLIEPNGSGGFSVKGSHTYDRFGTYSIIVTITDTFLNLTDTVATTATVYDLPIEATWVDPPVPGGLGVVNGVVSEVIDTNPNGLASDLSAIIHWGDDTESAGTITKSGGKFLVSGVKAYTAMGIYDVRVVVTSLGGSTAEAVGTIRILNDPPVFDPIDDQEFDEGETAEFVVRATDPNLDQTVRYQIVGSAPQHVSIDSATGLVRVEAGISPGVYDIKLRAFDSGTPMQSTTQNLKLIIRNLTPTIALDGALPQSLETGSLLSMTGSITDLPGSGPWNVEVDYGTGEGFVPVIYSSPRNFSIARTYATAGDYEMRVRVTDAAGAVAQIGSTIRVIEPPLAAPVRVEAVRDSRGRVTSLRLFFSAPLDATTAKTPTNYALSARPGRDGIFGTRDDGPIVRFRRVAYDAASNSVTLTPAMPIALRGRATARVRVSGLMDTRGRLFDGDRNGLAGGDLILSLSASSVDIV